MVVEVVVVVIGVVVVEVVEVAVSIVRFTGILVIPDMAAIILVVPSAIPVTNPVEEMAAILVLELVQVTCELMSIVEPFE